MLVARWFVLAIDTPSESRHASRGSTQSKPFNLLENETIEMICLISLQQLSRIESEWKLFSNSLILRRV